MATLMPVGLWMAEQTTPYAPSPMTVSTWYFVPTLNLTRRGSCDAAFLLPTAAAAATGAPAAGAALSTMLAVLGGAVCVAAFMWSRGERASVRVCSRAPRVKEEAIAEGEEGGLCVLCRCCSLLVKSALLLLAGLLAFGRASQARDS